MLLETVSNAVLESCSTPRPMWYGVETLQLLPTDSIGEGPEGSLIYSGEYCLSLYINYVIYLFFCDVDHV